MGSYTRALLAQGMARLSKLIWSLLSQKSDRRSAEVLSATAITPIHVAVVKSRASYGLNFSDYNRTAGSSAGLLVGIAPAQTLGWGDPKMRSSRLAGPPWK